MSVVKSKRNKSKVEFEMTYFRLAEGVDNLVSNRFSIEDDVDLCNRLFLETRFKSLERLTDDLILNIKIANSIYPTCRAELEERRLAMGKAIGICYAILVHYQRIMSRLRIPDDKYTGEIKTIDKMINSLKAWRKSDNKFKEMFNE